MVAYPPPQASVSGLRTRGFFCFGEPAEGFGSFYLYISMYCFLMCRGYIHLDARWGDFCYGLGVLDYSHEKVKRAVIYIYRFFSLHSARYIIFVPRSK